MGSGALAMFDPRHPDYTNTPASERRPRYGYAPADAAAAPAVSLITPFLNPGPVFAETVRSVFAQSLQQWEWIIVDDASDDPAATLALAELKDPRVRVTRLAERSGPAAARNRGVELARAPYVAFVDSDDLLEPAALEKWAWFLASQPQYAMVKGYQVGFGASEYLWREGFHSGTAILERNLIQTASMIRREVYQAAGGMDESIRGGMEDWDFWLRCAATGHWGGTIPEVLDWYRRRGQHSDRWENWDGAHKEQEFRRMLQARYPKLFAGSFPQPELSYPAPYSEIPQAAPFENRLRREEGRTRLLVIVPHLVMGGSDKFVLDLVAELTRKHGYAVTIAATLPAAHEWRHRFEELTPDVFTMDTFLPLRDYPRFLAYLIRSRGIESVLVTHSQFGYQLLPYLRAQFPALQCYDYVHIEELAWKEGGYPAFSLAYQPFLDRTAASSQHLKDWMAERGANPERISVVTTNVDVAHWSLERFDAAALRRKWEVPEDVPVILFSGWLDPRKQPHVLAAALRELHERRLPFLCLVAGDGEQAPWLREYLARHGLSEVRMLGSRSNDEVAELLAISDIYFLPSRHEGISLAIFEAMAMANVVVAAAVGGQRELVTPECGCLLERGEGEAERYAAVLAELLQDPEARQHMGQRARQRVAEHFRLETMGGRMAELLRSEPAEPFDAGRAFQSFAPGFAREIVEQRRVEWVADSLWAARPAPPPNVAATPAAKPAARRGVLWWRSAALLAPLAPGTGHGRNRSLLFQVLRRASTRQDLFRSFDRVFYACANPDIPPFGPFPLLHYVFYGYRENRRPSPDFDPKAFRRAFPEAGDEGNPLLRKIVLAAREGNAGG